MWKGLAMNLTNTAEPLTDGLKSAGVHSMADLVPLLRPTMAAIAAAVGPHCEVVLHDVSGQEVEHTIAAIENGHVTGRAIGGPSTNLGLEFLRRADGHDEYGYRARTRDGRELHCSSVYFHNTEGQLIGILCINVDITPWQAAHHALGRLLEAGAQAPERDEIFARDITEVLDNLIETAIKATGKPVALMDREDKVAVLQYLENKGAFHVKRAVDRVARRLKVSRVTAYNYLDQIRTQVS